MAADLDTNQLKGFIIDCRNLVNVLKGYTDGCEDQAIRDHIFRAILGFFANLASLEGVRTFLKEDQNGVFLKQVLPSIITEIGDECQGDNEVKMVAAYDDLMHRALFIADEYMREEDYNCFHHLNQGPRDKVMESLMLFYNQTGQAKTNMELRSLAGVFLEIDGKIQVDPRQQAQTQE